MNKKIHINDFSITPLTEVNSEAVYELVNREISFYSISFDYFLRGTLKDEGYSPELSLVLFEKTTQIPIGVIVGVLRKGLTFGKNGYIKILLVAKKFQRQGLGSELFKIFMDRMKQKLPWKSFLKFGDSVPRYWLPGVDLRHTSLFFFLKKFGFKCGELRQNLTYDLKDFNIEPKKQKRDYIYERVQEKDFDNLITFVKSEFSLGFWPQEALMSFENTPPTSFVAKNLHGEIVGWASHSAHFPGSFGPTGIRKELRGNGIGGELLRWCMWDIKQKGLETCTILWVVKDTVKFYSKTLGAYVFPTFYPMSKRI